MHILIVDDKLTVRESIAALISKQGFTFEYAINGLDALNKAKDQVFELYIIDHLMPIMDGIKLVHNLRSNAVTKNIPILFMSTQDISKVTCKVADKSFDSIIAKPLDPKLLSREINQLLLANSMLHSL